MLTAAQDPFDFRDHAQVEAEQREVAGALLTNSSRPDATRTVLRGLFPAAAHLFGGTRRASEAQWGEAKRVAAKSVLLRYLHLALATSEVAFAVVDRAVAALADGASFAALLETVDDTRLDDLLRRVRARVGEQPSADTLGCALVVLDLIPRLAEPRQFFEVDPVRRVVWFVEDLLESVGSSAARADVACRIVEQAPTLSLRQELLYRFRLPPAPSDNPALDLLSTEVYEELRSAICEEVLRADATELAGEANVLWLVELVHEVAGEKAAFCRLADRPVLRATLTQAGTRGRPRSDGGVRLHLEPLAKLGGHAVVPLLEQLLAEDDQLDDAVRDALPKRCRTRSATTARPTRRTRQSQAIAMATSPRRPVALARAGGRERRADRATARADGSAVRQRSRGGRPADVGLRLGSPCRPGALVGPRLNRSSLPRNLQRRKLGSKKAK